MNINNIRKLNNPFYDVNLEKIHRFFLKKQPVMSLIVNKKSKRQNRDLAKLFY
jgi:hypothetical protein